MTLPSSGTIENPTPINFQQIQNEFKGIDDKIQSATGKLKLLPSVWTDNTTPFPGRLETTGTATPSSKVTLTSSSTIGTKTSYGSINYSNTSNDNQPSEYSIPINEYYRGGLYVSDNDDDVNLNIPTSGEISLANFYDGIGGDIVLVISTNQENLNLETAFNAVSYPELINPNGAWTDKRRKRLIINTGVVIGGTSGNLDKCALKIPATLVGGLIIINYGNIVGYGGQQAQNGGDVILIQGPARIRTYPISQIQHNFTSGTYGVIDTYVINPTNGSINGADYRTLIPIGASNSTSNVIVGTGQFSVGDVISNSFNPSKFTITAKETATFTAYISNGTLTVAGYILSVTGGKEPKLGMGIISGTSYKKHIITSIISYSDFGVTFDGNQMLNLPNFSSFKPGMVLTGNGVLPGTIFVGYSGAGLFFGSGAFGGTTDAPTLSVGNSVPLKIGYAIQSSTQLNNGLVTAYITGIKTIGTSTTVYYIRYYNDTKPSSFTITYYARYGIINQSQTITNIGGDGLLTGTYFILNKQSSSETELVSNGSMTAIKYTINTNTSGFNSKTSNVRFFTAGGSTSPGFTATMPDSTLTTYLTQKQISSVSISGSSASAANETNSPIFNGTWNNVSILSPTTFFVTSESIRNNYLTTTPGSIDFISLIKILNYGKIYAGGGGGAGPIQPSLNSSINNIFYRGNISDVKNNKLIYSISAGTGPALSAQGGVGQGYNQNKTDGSQSEADPNAIRQVRILNGDSWTYGIDDIHIPENTQVNITANVPTSRSGPVETISNIYISNYSSPIPGYINTISAFFDLNITNLIVYGSNNTIKLESVSTVTTPGGVYITNFYRNSNQTYINNSSINGKLTIVNNPLTNIPNNPYSSYTNQVVVKVNSGSGTPTELAWPFPPQLLAKGGNGGLFGESGTSGVSGSGPSFGLSGNYIIGNAYVTWVNTGDVKGNVS